MAGGGAWPLVRLSAEFLRLSRWTRVSLPLPARLVRHMSSGEASLRGGSSAACARQQVVVGDQKTIVCYHPPANVPYQNSTPLRKQKVWERNSLTDEEVTLVRKLREEDSFVWTVNTLSRLLKVSPVAIRRVAPASEERRTDLHEERQLLKNMRRHKRKLHILQRQETRQSKLKELLATNKYPFPSTTETPQ